jgi:NADH dehydrogenase (ubiquinone) 1 alpha/beta subcomplex 1
MAFEEEFALEIPNAEADKLSSCAAAIDYIASHPRAK